MASLAEKGIDGAALDALASVPRETFLPPGERARAYEDRPIAIGHGQTCSQPLIVAVMVQALRLRPGASVLEVGAGSGYLAALLRAAGAGKVVAIELIPQLAAQARSNLNRAEVSGVVVVVGNGRYGAPGDGPYDAVVISASAPSVPAALLDQVADGGKLVAPVVGIEDERLWCLTREGSGWRRLDLGQGRFVPLLGDAGAEDSGREERAV